jgi:hypothetical protein
MVNSNLVTVTVTQLTIIQYLSLAESGALAAGVLPQEARYIVERLNKQV